MLPLTRRQLALQCGMITPRAPRLLAPSPPVQLGWCLLLVGSVWACRASDAAPDRASAPAKPEQTAQLEQKAVLDPGCPHQDGHSCAPAQDAASTQTQPTQWFGAQFQGTEAAQVALDKVLADPQAYHEKQVIVDGQVRRACSRRGCWMEIAPSTPDHAQSCRVTFKDYAFLVPTDAAGSWARLLGTVQVTVIPSAAVQHYESEGATFDSKRSDGSALEVRIVATGVELTRKS